VARAKKASGGGRRRGRQHKYNEEESAQRRKGNEVDGEHIDTAGRVDQIGPSFADRYGTSYALSDEAASEVVYALFTDDDRVRERIAELVGSRVQVRGTKLPEEPDDEVTKMNVTEIDPA